MRHLLANKLCTTFDMRGLRILNAVENVNINQSKKKIIIMSWTFKGYNSSQVVQHAWALNSV